MLVLSVVLSAKIWVNAIRDPGAELGAGDWQTEKLYQADSARVSAHDSSRAYEGKFSFLTDTDKDPKTPNAECHVWCYQTLKVPKAIKDIDSCFWMTYTVEKDELNMLGLAIRFHSKEGKKIFWFIGRGSTGVNDSLCYFKFPLPDSGVWTEFEDDLQAKWTEIGHWSDLDTIVMVQLRSEAWKSVTWLGQDASWDNIVLRSVAYYDYASKSIDSDELTDPSYTPIVTFANEGIKADKDAFVYAEILSGSTRVYVDSLKVSIPKESSKQVTFKPWSVVGEGPFTLRAYPMLELDELSTDDTVTKSIGGINEPVTPATPVTPFQFEVSLNTQDVEFSFAQGMSGELSIFDVCGREVFRSAINPNTGDLHWSTRGMPSGLYFSRFVSGKEIFSNKFLIIN